MKRILILLLMTIVHALASEEGEIEIKQSLPLCKRINACGATLSTYPTLEDTTSSGWTSGVVPLYDELLTNEIFDFSAEPDMRNFHLCACPNNSTCEFDSEDNSVKLDNHLTLRLCREADFPTVCKRNVAVVRVIGPAHLSGDSVEAVSNAAVFCKCASGFTRTPFEQWGGNEIMLNYKCL
ncbi:unnamed protein product [Caenorhabditis auriculariae]|uniref:Uncharacterized protein n=1 Tax=Caenorhabditis auriculariae TaxID=2777116 RepID=A0A8S1GMG5_9PELO|nr:unnamed protein product [Caenorhabditis auriculariae]